MKLFRSDHLSRRIYKYVDDFQREMQNGNYWAAQNAVDKALKIDPLNEKLLSMKQTTLELIQMQEAQRKPSSTEVTPVIKHGQEQDEFKRVKATLQSYRGALAAGDVDAGASMWDESSKSLTYISAEDGAVYKGHDEIREALRSAASKYNYIAYTLMEQGIEHYANLAYAFYGVRVEPQPQGASENVLGIKFVTLVLRKRGHTWKIVHGHESALMPQR
ncbi:MAG: YybH family protein [Halobacteriota archaeon]